jgi:hypothetical protein
MPHRVALAGLALVSVAACTDAPTGAADPAPTLRLGARASAEDVSSFVERFELDAPLPCDGLARNGVRYAFRVADAPSAECVAGAPVGPPGSLNVLPPHLEGDPTGELTLTFDVPTTRLGFGLALATREPLDGAVIVELHRPGAGSLRDSVALEVTKDPDFVGGRYDYAGPAVGAVTLRFASAARRFAIDDVSYERPRGRNE